MITVTEAKKLITEQTTLLQPVTMKIENACGHILAKDVFAIYNIPAFRQSSMDGYAIIFADKSLPLLLTGEMPAGTANQFKISAGETARIFTGAPLPEGADTVVMQEKITVDGKNILINDDRLALGVNVREIGSEIKTGGRAMQSGDLLMPAALGFLAGIGITEVEVFPMPRVAIILTGRELQKPGHELAFGQVYESNSYSLASALRIEGIHTIEILEADDDLEILTNILQSSLESNDVILLTGGVSVGDYDFVLEASQKCGIKQIFHKVKQKPGKPLFFGTKNEKLIFGLPGNPSSVLSCYYNFVLPALKMLSAKENTAIQIEATLTHQYTKAKGLTHFLKGNFCDGAVTPLNAQESFRLSSFAQANCLVCLPEEVTKIEAGETVNIILLPD